MKNTISLSFLTFICFLVIGYSSSTIFFHPNDMVRDYAAGVMVTNSPVPIQSMKNGQRSILIIGVDSINNVDVHLQSLWLLTYLPSDFNVNLLPIFPLGKNGLSEVEYKLYRSFNISTDEGELKLDQDFIKVLQDNNFWWSGFFVFDPIAQSKVLSILDEKKGNQGSSNNDLASQEIPNVLDDPQAAFISQLTILQSACQVVSGLSQGIDWFETLSSMQSHYQTDLNVRQITQEWKSAYSNGHSPNCQFPTLIALNTADDGVKLSSVTK